ncbi:HD-GYP domain-containing protein [Natranaerofaba carboxydovora]|uniref:HD-GYP domain-containing protein n=1 Tax=Natranaerofaba carboxydovora TaxID=2742683 RepID=UPI001F14288D|nr:HD domain-containing phosphohydrolase [Natranaerofaba carboxydovora]UMZ74214.1 3'3'-cGAMP-specific phosphodiesterase 3 [Natranaerofaba carboxydovora]
MKKIEKYHVSEIKPGMKLGKDIVKNEIVLYPKDNVITEKVINFIKNWGIEEVYVQREDENVIQNRERKELKVKHRYQKAVERTTKFMEGLKQKGRLDIKEVNELAEDLYKFSTDHYLFIKLMDQLQGKNSYLLQHSVNVGLFSSLLARWLRMDEAQIKEVGLTGLLHDIGRIYIRRKELKEFMEHPYYGYDIITKKTSYGDNIAKGVYQHHERADGSGYPRSLKSKAICSYAKIIAVVDTFDEYILAANMEKKCAFKAIEIIKESAFDKLDPLSAFTFGDRMLDLLVGAKVVLNDEKVGEVVMVNREKPTYSLVKVGDEFIDLSKETSLKISEVLAF